MTTHPRIEATYRFDDEDAGASDYLVAHALRRVSEEVASGIQLRAVGGQCYCRSVTLLIEMADHHCLQDAERLACPTHDAGHLGAAAQRLLGRLRPAIDHPIGAITLSATDLDGGSQAQLTITGLDDNADKRERQNVLDGALSRLWRRYGPRAVISAALLSQARRIHLWTHTLAKMRSEPIRVYTTRSGAPMRYLRHKKQFGSKEVDYYDVVNIIDNWRTADWKWGELAHRNCWRVESRPNGIHELHHLDTGWVLESEAD